MAAASNNLIAIRRKFVPFGAGVGLVFGIGYAWSRSSEKSLKSYAIAGLAGIVIGAFGGYLAANSLSGEYEDPQSTY